MIFLQTNSNIEKLYIVGKYFFVTSMNSGSLSQNKAPFNLDQLVTFVIFCTKMCVNDPGTFIGNGGYYLEEEAVLITMASMIAVKNDC